MDWISSLIPDISLPTANKFYTFGWAFSLIGAAITFVAVLFLMWGTRVRDHDFERNIGTLHDRAASSEKQSKQLEQGNLILQRDLERERIERLRLEEKIKPREITAEQRVTILACLKNGPKGVVYMRPKSFDPEPEQYSKQISELLKEAGFDVRKVEEATLSWTMTGARLLMQNVSSPPAHATYIQRCFGAAGITFLAGSNDRVPANAVMFAISTRL